MKAVRHCLTAFIISTHIDQEGLYAGIRASQMGEDSATAYGMTSMRIKQQPHLSQHTKRRLPGNNRHQAILKV
jgi:hypothetical protein